MVMRELHRRREGLAWLLVGCFTFGAAFLLSVATANWRWLLYATSVFMLSFAMALILLVQPPKHSRPTWEHLRWPPRDETSK
jgi:hypothetical protein